MLWKSLGGIRFVLALIVACGHLGWFVGPQSKVVLLGNDFSAQVAVLGFLVISGFSIGASYFRQPKDYYKRRVVRIVPLYCFGVIASAFIPSLHDGSIENTREVFTTPGLGNILGNLLFLQGFFVKYINTNGVVWTLSIEVFFYVITPFLAGLRPQQILLACLGSCAAYGAWRFFDLPFYADMQCGAAVLFMGWAWLLGFWIYRMNLDKDAVFAALVIGICVIAFNGSYLGWLWSLTWCLTIAGIGWGALLPANKVLAYTLQTAGDVSYPLYLIHMPCFLLLQISPLPKSPLLWILITIVVSFLLDRIYDRPVKAWMRKSMNLGAAS